MALALDQSSQKTEIEQLEEGMYQARIVQIIDLGRQYIKNWKTGEIETYEDGNPKIVPRVWINFEFPTELITVNEEEKPRWLGKEYTISNHEKSGMFKLLKAVKKEGIADLSEVLGEPLMVTVGLTSTGKNKISDTAPLMKGMQVEDLVNEPLVYDVDTGDIEVYDKLPAFIRTMIEERLQ